MKNIIIAGTGFAGLTTIKRLRQKGCTTPISLIAPRLEMFYQPAMIWVPAGIYQKQDVTFPLDRFIQRYDVDYIPGSITGLNAKQRRLGTTAGEMEYEQFVIATGGHSLKRLPGIEHTLIPCDGYAQVMAMTERLAVLEKGTLAFGFSGNAEQPAAIRSEPLFEFLFGVDTLLRRQKRRHCFDLIFFTPCPEIDFRWGPCAGNLKKELERRDIVRHVGYPLHGFTADRVLIEGHEVRSDLIVFMPEIVGQDWVIQSDLPLSKDYFIHANSDCRVLGFEGNVYVAGDAGCFPGPDWIPKQGHMADLQAQTLAMNLIGDIRGEQTKHHFRQEFICIVDTLDSAILVSRDMNRSLVFRSKALHWAKRLFIWQYLYGYRSDPNSKFSNT